MSEFKIKNKKWIDANQHHQTAVVDDFLERGVSIAMYIKGLEIIGKTCHRPTIERYLIWGPNQSQHIWNDDDNAPYINMSDKLVQIIIACFGLTRGLEILHTQPLFDDNNMWTSICIGIIEGNYIQDIIRWFETTPGYFVKLQSTMYHLRKTKKHIISKQMLQTIETYVQNHIEGQMDEDENVATFPTFVKSDIRQILSNHKFKPYGEGNKEHLTLLSTIELLLERGRTPTDILLALARCPYTNRIFTQYIGGPNEVFDQWIIPFTDWLMSVVVLFEAGADPHLLHIDFDNEFEYFWHRRFHHPRWNNYPDILKLIKLVDTYIHPNPNQQPHPAERIKHKALVDEIDTSPPLFPRDLIMDDGTRIRRNMPLARLSHRKIHESGVHKPLYPGGTPYWDAIERSGDGMGGWTPEDVQKYKRWAGALFGRGGKRVKRGGKRRT